MLIKNVSKNLNIKVKITVCTQTGSIGAGAVSGAAVVAGLDVTEVAVPPVVAGAVAGFARPVWTAIHVATFWKKHDNLFEKKNDPAYLKKKQEKLHCLCFFIRLFC